MDLAKSTGHWMGEALFRNRPFKPLVERSSRSTLTNPHMWGCFLLMPIYSGLSTESLN